MNQTKGSMGSTMASRPGEEEAESEWDILGGKRVLYPNGNTCSYFKKDGRFVDQTSMQIDMPIVSDVLSQTSAFTSSKAHISVNRMYWFFCISALASIYDIHPRRCAKSTCLPDGHSLIHLYTYTYTHAYIHVQWHSLLSR